MIFSILNTDNDIVKLQKDQHHDEESEDSGPYRSPWAAHPPRMEHVEGKFTFAYRPSKILTE